MSTQNTDVKQPQKNNYAILFVATHSSTLGAIPVFLLGALAVLLREELAISEFGLGQLVSAYYATSAVASIPGGRLSERLGAHRAVSVAAGLSGMAMLGVALLARNWTLLLIFMMIAGVGNGISLPATNLLVARGIPIRRQGLAFGIKQSSGPIATLIAGLCVPFIGLTIGWRWAFGLLGLAAIPLLLQNKVGAVEKHKHVQRRRPDHLAALIILAFGACAAVIGGSSLGAFYVESAVNSGVSPGTAGSLLAAGSVTGIFGRIGWGVLGDKRHSAHAVLLGALLLIGATGYLLLGRVEGLLPIGLATFLVVVFAWGWPALFNFAVVMRNPETPAIATGIVGTGLYSGGIIGPVLFGAIVERSGYTTAWTLIAISAASSGILFYSGAKLLDQKVARSLLTKP